MTAYGYVALNKQGKEIKGSYSAENEKDVAQYLKNKGFTPITITKQSFLTQDLNIEIGKAASNRDLSLFSRQFVSMSKAGIPIIEAMRLLAEQTENKRFQKALFGVSANLEKGGSLAESMELYPKVFPELMINSVAAGEATGSLETSFERLAIQLEMSSKTQAALKKAMIYPIIVAIVALVVVIVMLVKVIPAYSEMFDEMGSDLPGITKAVVTVSNFIVNRWFILIIIIAGLVVAIRFYAVSDMGKHFFGRLALILPVFGKMNIKNASSMFSRTISTLITSGVPMEDALEITAKVMPNILFRDALMEARNLVLQGVPLSKPLEDCGLFPPMVYHMCRIGEESGEIDTMLTKLAGYYDEEVQEATASMMAALEPMIIVVLAVVVGTLVAACIAPMLDMYKNLDGL